MAAVQVFNDTLESFDSIKQTVSGDWSTGWGVEVNHSQYADDFNNHLTNGVQGLVEAGITYGNNIYSTGQNLITTFTDGQQYVELADAAGSAALNYLNDKIQRIKDAWTTTTSVSVGAILGEVAPYCVDFSTAISKVGERVSSLVGYLLGVNGDSWEDLGTNLLNDVSSSLLNDPAVQSSVSNLGIIKTFASALETVTSIVNVVNAVLKILEPAFPYLEIATNLVLSMWSGGTSSVEAGSKMTQTVEQECQKLISLLAYSLRKALYNIHIEVPVLLVGALETLSVRDAMAGYDSEMSDWLKAIFSDEFYKNTINSLTWQKSISESLNTIINWSSSDASQIIADMLGTDDQTLLGENMKNRFLSSLTVNFMNNALRDARKKAYIPIPGSIEWLNSADFGSMMDSILGNFETPTTSTSNLDKILSDDYDLSPITDEESVRSVSKMIYDTVA